MKKLNVQPSLQLIKRIAPEHHKVAKAFLNALPRGWHLWLPTELQLENGKISRQLIAHAVLHIYAPHIFHCASHTRRLADFMLLQLAWKHGLYSHIPTIETPVFPLTP